MVAKSKFSETIFFLQVLPKYDVLDLKMDMGHLWTNVGFKPFLDQIESANWPFVAVE